jgi:hypothetical protein
MSRIRQKFGVWFLSLLFVALAFGASQDEKGLGFEKYAIIAERDIFSRYKGVSRQNAEGTAETYSTKIMRMYILRGISQQGQRKLAFIEEEISGEIIRAAIGENIHGWRIEDIAVDFILCEKDGQQHTIPIGSELSRTEGQTPDLSSSLKTSEKNDKPRTTDAKTNDNQDEVLKKMLERRKNQVGK